MPMQSLGTTRRGALTAALAGTSALLLPTAARAAPTPPAPTGDDIGFLTFGAVAEGVLTRVYSDMQGVRGAFSPSEKRLLAEAHDRQLDNVTRLNTALGPDDAIPLEDFSRAVRLGTRAGALKVARRLETLVIGVYLNGVGYAADEGSRLLLGRLLAVAGGHQALLTRLAGEHLGGLPKPIDLQGAGPLLDTYLKDPTS
jgi:hypothetical protein